jgi:Matrixin
MLNLKKTLALAIIASFLASIPLTLATNNQLVSATYTIEVDDLYARPGGSLGGGGKGYTLTGYHWDTLPVAIIVNPTYNGLSENFVLSAVDAGAETWDAATGMELVHTSTDSSATADTSTADGKNEVVFGNLGDSRIIAQCTYWYYLGSKHLADFDIVFNTQFGWGDASTDASKMDLQNIATHEIGHGFGLGDIYQSKLSALTMYGYAGEGQTNKRTLEPGDIAGIQALYGA